MELESKTSWMAWVLECLLIKRFSKHEYASVELLNLNHAIRARGSRGSRMAGEAEVVVLRIMVMLPKNTRSHYEPETVQDNLDQPLSFELAPTIALVTQDVAEHPRIKHARINYDQATLFTNDYALFCSYCFLCCSAYCCSK